MTRVSPTGATGKGVLTAVCIVALAGCSFRRPFPERQAAVAAVSGMEISGAPLLAFMRARSGFVVQEVQIVPPDVSDGQATTLPTQISFVFVGTAAAIDTRGYYLTAAHVVSTTPVSILSPAGRMMEAHVVWRGNPTVADLALLRVPTTVDRIFKWSPRPASGEQVIGGGPTRTLLSGKLMSVSMQLEAYGGTVRRVLQGHAAPVELTIRSSTPLLSGDSGGPLVNSNGQLVGINARSDLTVHLLEVWKLGRKDYVGEADRPDLVWLRKLIDDDSRSNPRVP